MWTGERDSLTSPRRNTMTLDDLFPGKLGRVKLTSVAIKLRKPMLLKQDPSDELPQDLVTALQSALTEISKG